MGLEAEPLIAIVGPTATGKTRRAVSLAKAFDGEVVSGDSRQVYRGMDIGTGKDLSDYGQIPYHLIDICEAGEKYNLHRYLGDYSRAVNDIRNRGKLPVLCGGSGMYVENALNGIVMPEVGRNHELRRSLEGKTLEELKEILQGMKRLHNDTDVDTIQRALRAIEIQTYYHDHPDEAAETKPSGERTAVIIGIDIPRDTRRQLISERLRKRLDEGMVEEVDTLLKRGVKAEDLIYYGLEYKWVTMYLTGDINREVMVRELEIAIHQFAKRQMTWFRGMERRGWKITWLPWDLSETAFIEKAAELLAS